MPCCWPTGAPASSSTTSAAPCRGRGADAGVASTVAAEIDAAGGTAIADEHDVASADGAQALIDAALEQFGRLDILINNAGIMQWAGLPDVDRGQPASGTSPSTSSGRSTPPGSAWPPMVEQGYGRIVMTTSSGIFGLPKNLSYATAKGGVIGLTRSIATMSEAHGIKVNLIAPAAMHPHGRAGRRPDDTRPPQWRRTRWRRWSAFLAHEACPVNGEMYAAGAGRFARIFIASTPGYVPDADPTIEDVAEHWDEHQRREGYVVPRDLPDWSTSFLAHLPAARRELRIAWTSRSTKPNGTSSASAATSRNARSPPVRRWPGKRPGARPTSSAKWVQLGLLGMLVPEEWGGIGMSTVGFVAAMEQIGQADQSVAAAWQAHVTIGSLPLLLFGNDDATRALAAAAGRGTGAGCVRADRARRRLRRPRHPHPGPTT